MEENNNKSEEDNLSYSLNQSILSDDDLGKRVLI